MLNIFLLLVFLNLTFMLGQFFYYSRETDKVLTVTPQISGGNLSANLLGAVQQKFALVAEGKELVIDPDELKNWIESYTRNYNNKREYRIKTERIRLYLENLSEGVNIPPINARLEMGDGKITEFTAPQAGRVLNVSKTLSNITAALAHNSSGSDKINPELVIDDVQPEVSLDK